MTDTYSDDFDKMLDDFISKQLNDVEDSLINAPKKSDKTPENNDKTDNTSDPSIGNEHSKYLPILTENKPQLAMEETRLFDAIINLIKSSIDCALEANIKIENFTFDYRNLVPRFSPNRIQNISENIIYAWELLIQAQPERLSSLQENPSDEQILSYAEKTTHKSLMLALISYVESLVELDACEIAYNLRKAKYKKYKIERKIYEEEMMRKEKTRLYIDAIKKQNFPIDAELLVNNFFKTARKDPDAAKKIIEQNPATFAPIQIDKIPDRLFGLIKAKPEDGIKINKKIGNFIKNLKV